MNKKHEKVIAPDVGWRNVTRAGIIPTAGNAEYYETGGWRTKKPVWIEDKCIHCLLCWRFCRIPLLLPKTGSLEDLIMNTARLWHMCKCMSL